MSLEKVSTPRETAHVVTGASTSTSFITHLKKLVTRFPVRDTRYLAAANFFVGASLFVANGFLYVFLTKQPQLVFDAAALPVTSVLGTFFFLLGCSTAVLEAMNTVGSTLDGTAIVNDDLELGSVQVNEKAGMTETGLSASSSDGQSTAGSTPAEQSRSASTSTIILMGAPGFKWVPSTKDMKDVAFWAAMTSLIGIIPFYISAIAYVPGVADLTNVNTYYYLALLPYCLGGCCFTIGAVIPMFMVQRKWYLPALNDLTWWSYLLWTVGSFGFALGGSLWYAGEGQYWSATLASFWGAWCWVVGSVVRCLVVAGEY